jgi:hypothetical protein
MFNYYAGSGAYRKLGPPDLPLRLMAPLFVAATIALFASGVLLLGTGHKSHEALTIHKLAAIVFGVTLAVHVLAYIGAGRALANHRLARGPSSGRPRRRRTSDAGGRRDRRRRGSRVGRSRQRSRRMPAGSS